MRYEKIEPIEKKWAHTYINGSYVAKYFVDILDNKEVKFIY